MKHLTLVTIALVFVGCANLTPQQRALLGSAETIASVAATAAATVYGGPAAGQLASAGLSALGQVLQGYTGMEVPKAVVENSPGIAGVGAAVAAIIPPQPVSQKTVDTVNRAAAIAATLKSANILPIVQPSPPPVQTPPVK